MRLNWPLVLFRHAVAGLLVLAWVAAIFTKQPPAIAIGMTFVMLGSLAVIASQTVLMIEATTGQMPQTKDHLQKEYLHGKTR
ncbi:MAG: hypothetical protein M1343_09705 [Chloroflexi bacterium]|nr:hypothetical protein [Chloroflexota bacterium]MDA8187680.1 hypothetical protein [Dehalococcoidales bacterium]